MEKPLRNIPDLQPSWMHTPRIPRKLRLQKYTHLIFCRPGIRPPIGTPIISIHRTRRQNVFTVRDINLNPISKHMPDCNNPILGEAD
jgi:hypothetical protein